MTAAGYTGRRARASASRAGREPVGHAVRPRPRDAYKRAFDLAILCAALAALAPLWVPLAAAVAAAVRCRDGGPVLYRQTRLGRHGRPFEMVRFRTMPVGAEAVTGPVAAGDRTPGRRPWDGLPGARRAGFRGRAPGRTEGGLVGMMDRDAGGNAGGARYLRYRDDSPWATGLNHQLRNLLCLLGEAHALGRLAVLPRLRLSAAHNAGVARDWRWETYFDLGASVLVEPDGAERPLPPAPARGRGRRPVINVSWNGAQNYVAWLSTQTGGTYRLPSEAEWEYATRAGSSTKYSWGDEIGANRANCEGCGSQWNSRQTAPVGSFRASAFGLYDMHGNAYEWVEDCWNGSHAGAPSDGGAWLQGTCDLRVLRGGSWLNSPRHARAAYRDLLSDDRYDDNGFRVARTLTP